MRTLKRAYYEARLERDYSGKRGTEFQDFFSEIMEKRYPGDFVRVRPWGSVGDRKNDGYLPSRRMLFQVFAPNEMKAEEAINKIDEDFRGASRYWEEFFDTWVFVHNSRDGLSPGVLRKLLELREEFSRKVVLTNWGFEEIRREVFSLSMEDISSLLGQAPTDRDLLEVGFSEIRVLLDGISSLGLVAEDQIRCVPHDKLLANALSPYVGTLLKAGMTKSAQVGSFIDHWHDPTLGDRMAQTFAEHYRLLKKEGLPPDEIFWRLEEFTGGCERRPPREEAGVLAILAYLFERCDIFERPRMEG